MKAIRNICLGAAGLFLLSCSTSDFFLGRDNRPEAKPLPVVAGDVRTTVLWRHHLGDSGTEQGLTLQPAYQNGKIYAVSADGRLSVIDADNGKILSENDLGNRISAGVGIGAGQLFIGTAGGSLLALNAQTGQPLWREQLPAMILAAPVFADGLVFARTTDGTITAFDAGSGAVLWRYHTAEPLLSVRGNARPVIGGGVVILTTDSGEFVVLDERSGLPVIEQHIAVGRGSDPVARLVDMDTTAQIRHDILYAAAYQSMIFAIDLQAGMPLWEQNKVSTPKDIALNRDGIFLVSDIDHVIALNQRDGSIRWQNDALEGRYLSAPFALGNLIGVLDGQGYLHWLDARNGTLLGQKKIADSSAGVAAQILNDRVIWQLNDGSLIAFRPESPL